MSSDERNLRLPPLPRREFIKLTTVGSLGAIGATAGADSIASTETPSQARGTYENDYLSRVAFPLGGIGAGMVCLEGSGAISHVSVRNRPDVFNEPCVFAALSVTQPQRIARVLEGPVPAWKLFGGKGDGEGAVGATFGLPRCSSAKFTTRFPFCSIELDDQALPVDVQITGWSPFTPGDADHSSLPCAALEYRIANPTDHEIEAVFSFNAKNFMEIERSERRSISAVAGGFVLHGAGPTERPWEDGSFAISTDDPDALVNHAWFRGGWIDGMTMAWRDVEQAAAFTRAPVGDGEPAPGATIFVPFRLAPGASRTIVIRFCWYVPATNLAYGDEPEGAPKPADKTTHRPWYAQRFADIQATASYWSAQYAQLRQRSTIFADCFYDSTLPAVVVDAIAANLAILKSPTMLRQADGRLWAWEGSGDEAGRGEGTCTHVWNYAQAIAHLFPDLERTLRETEFGPSQDERGHQMFRTALPIRPMRHHILAASDGQLGGIIKMYREWRVSGDTPWLRRLWPRVRASLDYCIRTWDPRHRGWLEDAHHNTYDIEFWGPDAMCTSYYLGALTAATRMGRALDDDVASYAALAQRCRERLENQLFNGEYFIQKVEWQNRRNDATLNPDFMASYSTEARKLASLEGPKYQYGDGCLSDGIVGAWLAKVCGLGDILNAIKVHSHLQAVHRYNLKHDLSAQANPQRSGYAGGREGGLLLCSWPRGGKPSLPFNYSDEVWTGIEYQVASHLIMMNAVNAGLEIVQICRARYDGRVRNPFDEYEYGHWYGRALASYALLQSFSGARYDAIDKTLYLEPSIPGDFRCFLATATGYGTVGVRDGKPFLDVCSGRIDISAIKHTARA